MVLDVTADCDDVEDAAYLNLNCVESVKPKQSALLLLRDRDAFQDDDMLDKAMQLFRMAMDDDDVSNAIWAREKIYFSFVLPRLSRNATNLGISRLVRLCAWRQQKIMLGHICITREPQNETNVHTQNDIASSRRWCWGVKCY